jgi:hypothetical protein
MISAYLSMACSALSILVCDKECRLRQCRKHLEVTCYYKGRDTFVTILYIRSGVTYSEHGRYPNPKLTAGQREALQYTGSGG